MTDTVKLVAETLQEASKYKLEVEVFSSALEALKGDPTQSIEECLAYGLSEWVK